MNPINIPGAIESDCSDVDTFMTMNGTILTGTIMRWDTVKLQLNCQSIYHIIDSDYDYLWDDLIAVSKDHIPTSKFKCV